MTSQDLKTQASFDTIEIKMKYAGRGGETGFVSIFSVIIIMAILALITIGFTNVTRRAQRNTLDNQQATQAFYAAESGVNDAKRAIIAAREAPIPTDYNKTTCDGDPTNFNYVLSADLAAGYTCVLVDSTPPSLVYDTVPVIGAGEPIVAPLRRDDGGTVDTARITWDSPQGLADPIPATGMAGSNPILPDQAGWGNGVGMLRVDLVPITSLGRSDMVTNSYTVFLVPSTSGVTTDTISPGTAEQGRTIAVDCGTVAPRCQVTLTLGAPSAEFRMRLTSYYQPTRIHGIEILNGGTVVDTAGGQALIDSTGRSNDVFRRIQVRMPLNASPGLHVPFALLSAGDVCKRLIAAPPSGSSPGVAITEGVPSTAVACQVPL